MKASGTATTRLTTMDTSPAPVETYLYHTHLNKRGRERERIKKILYLAHVTSIVSFLYEFNLKRPFLCALEVEDMEALVVCVGELPCGEDVPVSTTDPRNLHSTDSHIVKKGTKGRVGHNFPLDSLSHSFL
jgi:hypothetical protein